MNGHLISPSLKEGVLRCKAIIEIESMDFMIPVGQLLKD